MALTRAELDARVIDELRAEVESNKALLARWARVGFALTELLETWEQNNTPSSILPGETLTDAHARELREALEEK